MIPISVVIGLILLHLLGDWFLQTTWMAVNKSKNWTAIYTHVFVYSLCFIPFGMEFCVITFICHFITDAITSRLTTRWFFFYEDPDTGWSPIWENRSWFFNTIGIDQAIHFITLLLTYHYVVSR